MTAGAPKRAIRALREQRLARRPVGTRIYAAKALDAEGSGSTSTIVCAIDWLTGTRTDGP